MPEPHPVIPLDYSGPAARSRGRGRTVRALLVLGALAAMVALVLIVAVDVETVLVTGPVLFAIGCALLIFGILGGRFWPAVVGAAHAAICLLFVGMVNLFGWTPNDAEMPFTVAGCLYVLAALPASGYAGWKPDGTPT